MAGDGGGGGGMGDGMGVFEASLWATSSDGQPWEEAGASGK